MPREAKPPRDLTGWIDVRGDGGIMKRLMREGNVEAGLPIDGMCAKVHYDCWIEGGWFDGRKVESSRDRPDEDGDYMFLLGDTHEAVTEGYVMRGLNYAAETMYRGEMAEFIIRAEYAHGAKGSKKPKVPPNTNLRVEVEMLTWKPSLSHEKNMLQLPWWERLELAHATKESANQHFREGQPEEARERYWKAGMLMDVIGNKGTEIEMPEERIAEQNALGTLCWLNEAMCYIRMAQNEEETGRTYKGVPTSSATNPTLWRKAIESCDTALALDPNSAKAFYRKGLAYQHLHEFRSAEEMYARAAKANPGSKEVREQLELCRWQHAEATQADAKLFQKIMRKTQEKGLYAEKPDVAATSASSAFERPHVWLSFAVDGEPAGFVEMELWADQLPKTCENFRQLATGEKGNHPLTRRPLHYKGSPIHRVMPGLGIQGGDIVAGDGSSGESIYGSFFADEGFYTKHDSPGILSMANQGRDTNRSQFFITTEPAPWLDGRHVAFGKVTRGMDVVRRIEMCPAQGERPTVRVQVVDCGQGDAPANDDVDLTLT